MDEREVARESPSASRIMPSELMALNITFVGLVQWRTWELNVTDSAKFNSRFNSAYPDSTILVGVDAMDRLRGFLEERGFFNLESNILVHPPPGPFCRLIGLCDFRAIHLNVASLREAEDVVRGISGAIGESHPGAVARLASIVKAIQQERQQGDPTRKNPVPDRTTADD
ncbi:MAG: hypothetical protein ACYTFI_08285 [Planctomycetota bacterium]